MPTVHINFQEFQCRQGPGGIFGDPASQSPLPAVPPSLITERVKNNPNLEFYCFLDTKAKIMASTVELPINGHLYAMDISEQRTNILIPNYGMTNNHTSKQQTPLYNGQYDWSDRCSLYGGFIVCHSIVDMTDEIGQSVLKL